MRLALLIIQWLIWLAMLYIGGSITLVMIAGLESGQPLESMAQCLFLLTSLAAGLVSIALLVFRRHLFWQTRRFTPATAAGSSLFLLLTLAAAFLAFMSVACLTLHGFLGNFSSTRVLSDLLTILFLILLFPRLPKILRAE